MELEPVTRTQVAVAAKAQAGEEPTEADMNQQALVEHAQRAEGYLEKVRFPPNLCFLATIIVDRLSLIVGGRDVTREHRNGIVTSCS